MKPSERIARHFDAHCGDGRASLVVPEWSDDDEPFVIYWKPVTLRDFGAAFPELTATPRGLVRIITKKAEDKNGKPLFPDADDHTTLQFKAEFTVVRRVAEQILAPLSVQDLIAKQVLDNMRSGAFWIADKLGKTIEEIETLSVKAFFETIDYYVKREQP